MEPYWTWNQQPQCQPHAGQCVIRLNGASVGCWTWSLHPHSDQTPGARLQCGLQPRWTAPGQWLLRQVCPYLEHAERCFSQQLQRDRRYFWSMLELHWRQSGRKCIRRIGLCIRPKEMTLPLGSHGPTMNVCIAKCNYCPWPIIHCCKSTHEVSDLSPDQQTHSVYHTHITSVITDCYIQTRSTHDTNTHLIKHHSKPRGPSSTPLKCTYCTRQQSSNGWGELHELLNMADLWPYEIDNSEYWHCMFSGSMTLELFSKKIAQGFFFLPNFEK